VAKLMGTSGTYSGALHVASGATVSVDTAQNQLWGSTITGSGTLAQHGSGTLRLFGNSSFSGQTTVDAGRTLVIGTYDGSAGTLGGNIDVAAGALLKYNRWGTNGAGGTVSNTLSGAGQVEFLNVDQSNNVNTAQNNGTVNLTLASPQFSGTVIVKPQVRAHLLNPAAFGTGTIRVEDSGQLWLDNLNSGYNGAALTNTVYLAGLGWNEGVGRLGAMRIDDGAQFSGNAVLTANTRLSTYGNTAQGTMSGVISEQGGSWSFEKWGTGRLTLTGASTYTGITYVSDGILRLANTNGPALYNGSGRAEVVIGHKVNSTGWAFPNVWAQLEFGANNQLGAHVDVTFDTENPFAYMTLRGTTQTVGNISTGRNPGWAVLQNVESAAHDSGVGEARLIFNQTRDLEFKGYLRDAWRDSAGRDSNTTPTSGGTKPALALEKYGTGKLTITTDTYNTGGITIHEGTLQIGDGNGIGSLDSRNSVNLTSTSSTLEYFRNNDVSINHNITGVGNVIFRGTGVSGQSHYDYNGTNSIGVDATITVDKARLRVDAGQYRHQQPLGDCEAGGPALVPKQPHHQ